MSAPRLVLKQSTGWFGAGWRFGEAMLVLSDEAFKLFAWLCLNADRHTGWVRAGVEEIALALRRDPGWVRRGLEELDGHDVCRASPEVVEVVDRYWPYEKLATGCGGADFAAQVRKILAARACVRCRFGAADENLARRMHERGVTVGQVERAVLLGCGRKYAAMLASGETSPIATLTYFEAVIEEVCRTTTPDSYWTYVARRVGELERQWVDRMPRESGS